MMEATRTSETLVNFYQTTQRYNPEDSHLGTNVFVMESGAMKL
jgi:predicted transcriptional regulator